jgi:hypothetical protein
MRKHVLVAALAACVGLVLAGCGSSGDQADRVDQGTTSTAAGSAVGTRAALATIRQAYPSYTTVPDEKIVAILNANCAAFDEGQTWLSSVKVLTGTGMSGHEAGVLIAASVALCPQHADKLP